jgi:hypothetical protein
MIRRIRAAGSILFMILVTFGMHGTASSQSGLNPQTASPQPQNNRQGFLDYALGRVNPQQADYGAQVAADRGLLVAETLDNLIFWSNAITLVLFTGVTTLYIFNLRSGEKKELIVASLITELWNGRLSDSTEIAWRTQQYNLLVEKHNALLALSAKAAAGNSLPEGRADARTQRKVERLIEGPRAPAKTEQPISAASNPRKTGSVQDSMSASDQQQQTLLLERRIEAMQNTEQNLRERLNQTTALLEQERQRNRTLKGA